MADLYAPLALGNQWAYGWEGARTGGRLEGIFHSLVISISHTLSGFLTAPFNFHYTRRVCDRHILSIPFYLLFQSLSFFFQHSKSKESIK